MNKITLTHEIKTVEKHDVNFEPKELIRALYKAWLENRNCQDVYGGNVTFTPNNIVENKQWGICFEKWIDTHGSGTTYLCPLDAVEQVEYQAFRTLFTVFEA